MSLAAPRAARRGRRAILLSGGAALGAVQVPIVEALGDVGRGDTVVGTSVGSLHAAMVGEGRADELRELWRDVGNAPRTTWFQRRNIDLWRGLYTLAPLRRQMIHRAVGRDLDLDDAADVRVGVTDLANNTHGLIRLNDMQWRDRIDACLCSSTQPAIHEGNTIRGRLRHDGGVAHVLPTLPDWRDYDEIHAVFCSPVGEARDRPRKAQNEIDNTHEALFAYLDWSIDRVVQADYERVAAWPQCTIYAPASWEAVGESMQASPDDIARRLAEGARMLDAPVRLATGGRP